jgi:hypothetical protein
MKTQIQVLSIGLEHAQGTTYSASSRHEYRFIAAKAYRELLAIGANENIRVAVLNPTLSRDELVRSARVVRWRWPRARILVVRAEKPHIDDGLYDDRVEPGPSPELLLAAINRITYTSNVMRAKGCGYGNADYANHSAR